MADVSKVAEGGTSRRAFLFRFLGVWGVVSVVPLVKGVLEYLTPKRIAETLRESLRVGSVPDVPQGTAKIFKFGKDPVIVVHTAGDQFRAFNARCTHLGCVVQFQPDPVPHFNCNCHGSQYDINGVNIAGPAPRPLAPMKVTIENASIVVTRT